MERWAIAIAVCIAMPAFRSAGEEHDHASEQSQFMAVQLVDSDGKPVEGADVSLGATVRRCRREGADDGSAEWRFTRHVRSDAHGVARLKVVGVDFANACIFARHPGRRIAATAFPEAEALDRPTTLTLQPECDVVMEAACAETAALGTSLGIVSCEVRRGGRWVLWCVADGPLVSIPLPPGKYEVKVRGDDVFPATRSLLVEPGTAKLDLGSIDLLATNFPRLVGKPAPEIPGVITWKNGSPGALAELRGKVVLLDFWGYWCGPCVATMPELFELHDAYHDQGLVIIGVHADARTEGEEPIDTVAQLDQRLSEYRGTLWGGRDIPFHVALVPAKRTRYRPEIEIQALSEDAALFGITGYPTQVLLDRRGNVVGRFHANAEGIKQLETLLRDR